MKWSSAPKHIRLCCWAALLPGAAGPAPASSWHSSVPSPAKRRTRGPPGRSSPQVGHAGRYGEQQTQALLLPGPQSRRPARQPPGNTPLPRAQGTASSTLHSDELKALSRQPSRRRASGPAWRRQARGWGKGPRARLGHVTPQTSSRFSHEHPFPTAPATLLGELLGTHVALNQL